jgi:serine/threonine protein kinase
LGTLMYMPPEGLEGLLTTSWDIWSLGIMIFIMTTNKLPYKFDNNEELITKLHRCEIDYDCIFCDIQLLVLR